MSTTPPLEHKGINPSSVRSGLMESCSSGSSSDLESSERREIPSPLKFRVVGLNGDQYVGRDGTVTIDFRPFDGVSWQRVSPPMPTEQGDLASRVEELMKQTQSSESSSTSSEEDGLSSVEREEACKRWDQIERAAYLASQTQRASSPALSSRPPDRVGPAAIQKRGSRYPELDGARDLVKGGERDPLLPQDSDDCCCTIL